MTKQAQTNTTLSLGNLTSTGTSAVVNLLSGDNFSAVITPTAVGTGLSNAGTAQLKVSNDGTTYINSGTATALTAGTSVGLTLDRPSFAFGKLVVTGVTGGTVNIKAAVLLTANVN